MRAAEFAKMGRNIYNLTNVLISEIQNFIDFLFWSSKFINDLQTKYIQGVIFFAVFNRFQLYLSLPQKLHFLLT